MVAVVTKAALCRTVCFQCVWFIIILLYPNIAQMFSLPSNTCGRRTEVGGGHESLWTLPLLLLSHCARRKELNKTLALSINHCFQPAWSEKRKKNHLHDFHHWFVWIMCLFSFRYVNLFLALCSTSQVLLSPRTTPTHWDELKSRESYFSALLYTSILRPYVSILSSNLLLNTVTTFLDRRVLSYCTVFSSIMYVLSALIVGIRSL